MAPQDVEVEADANPSPRKTVNFNPTVAFSTFQPATDGNDSADESAVLVNRSDAPTDPTSGAVLPNNNGSGKTAAKTARHPPVSLSAATGRRFAGFMRRRGSSGASGSVMGAPNEKPANDTRAVDSVQSGSSVVTSVLSSTTTSSGASAAVYPGDIEVDDGGSAAMMGAAEPAARRRASFAGINGRLGRVLRR
jgi:hypothetical protein